MKLKHQNSNSFFLFFYRYDFEKIEKDPAEKVIAGLREMVVKGLLLGQKHGDFVVKMTDDFRFEDSIDKSISEKQVW